MRRGLHHVTHTVRDLDALAASCERVGFTVGATNRHPWGTHNRIVQLDGFYVELLTVAEPEKIVPHATGLFSFGAFNRDFLARGEGLSMLALESRDADADGAEFRESGIGDFAVFRFEREGRRPDGARAKLGFSLAFASTPQDPDIGFFACQEHHPENFWSPALQRHRNGATGIGGVIIVAADPGSRQAFLSALVGEGEIKATSTGITLATPRGMIQVMDPAAFRSHFAVEPPDTSHGARLAALRFAVGDFGAAVNTLKAGKIDAQMRMGRIVIGAEIGMGATWVLEPG